VLKIRKQKKEKERCPICLFKIVSPNVWVQYHISYKPPLVVLACKYCNFCEYNIRNGLDRTKSMTFLRIQRVISFSKKFGVNL